MSYRKMVGIQLSILTFESNGVIAKIIRHDLDLLLKVKILKC